MGSDRRPGSRVGLSRDEAARDAHAAAIPQFAKYEQMTDRELPVVVPERIDED